MTTATSEEADKGGPSTCHLAEHDGTPLGLAPSPVRFLAAAAQVTTRIRLAPTTSVVSPYDPLRRAQEMAMLDPLHCAAEVGGTYLGRLPRPSARWDAGAPLLVAALG